MARHAIRCPDCGALLATERPNRAIRVLTSIVQEDGDVVLLCPQCGRRFVMERVVPYLLPIR